MPRASMPETAIHKKRHSCGRKDKIGTARQAGAAPPAPEPVGAKEGNGFQLGLPIPGRADARHDRGAFCGREDVCHEPNMQAGAQTGKRGLRSGGRRATTPAMSLTTVELCAGGGGQALGLEMAGFHHEAAVEYEAQFCTTLRKNRPHWNVLQMDIRQIDGTRFKGVDLIAAGVPCPPFSIAGKQLGGSDERDMFPAALAIISAARPRAVMLENVPGFAGSKFEEYRAKLCKQLTRLGYQVDWRVLQASDFGVPQLRPRFVLVGLRPNDAEHFAWPVRWGKAPSVGEALLPFMAENGWPGAEAWAQKASSVAPTIVGGSKKHGGPDLGPTRAKAQWRTLGVDGMGIADAAPAAEAPFDLVPRLTVRMVARLQSFPNDWEFTGGKTAAYRQVGNAFPPLVARMVATAIRSALTRKKLLEEIKCEREPQLKMLESPDVAASAKNRSKP